MPRRDLTRERAGARPAAPVRIVHLGLGAFFRAHQAWYTDRAPDAGDWGIAAFGGRGGDVAAVVERQGGVYTLLTRGPGRDTTEVVASISAARRRGRPRRAARAPGLARRGVVTAHGHRGGLLPRRRRRASTGPTRRWLPTSPRCRGRCLRPGPQRPRQAGRRARGAAPGRRRADRARAVRQPAGQRSRPAATSSPSSSTSSTRAWLRGSTARSASSPPWSTASPPPPATPTWPPSRRATGLARPGPRGHRAVQRVGDRGLVPRWSPGVGAGGSHRHRRCRARTRQRKLRLLNGGHSLLAYLGSRPRATPPWRRRSTTPPASRGSDAGGPRPRATCRCRRSRSRPTRSSSWPGSATRGWPTGLEQIAADGLTEAAGPGAADAAAAAPAGTLPPGAACVLAAWTCHLRGTGATVTDVRAAGARHARRRPHRGRGRPGARRARP